MIFAQVSETAEAASEFADKFGLQALLIAVLLVGGALGVWKIVSMFYITWADCQKDLVTSQKKFIDIQIDRSNQNTAALERTADASDKIGDAVGRLAINGETLQKSVTHIDSEAIVNHAKLDRVHEAARQSLMVAVDYLNDRPDIQGRLRQIAEGLRGEHK